METIILIVAIVLIAFSLLIFLCRATKSALQTRSWSSTVM